MAFVIKTRGAGGAILCEYLCPLHGRFETTVQRDANGDPPNSQPCPLGWSEIQSEIEPCGLPSDWTISAPRIKHPTFLSAHRGKSDPKPFPEAMDTEPLADGKVTYQEWKKQRAEMWHAHDYAEFKRNI